MTLFGTLVIESVCSNGTRVDCVGGLTYKVLRFGLLAGLSSLVDS